jgi:hypothetical protein
MKAPRSIPHLLGCLALLTGCVKMESPTPETARTPELEAGWVTNCAGPEFSQYGRVAPGPDQPVFKATDQLVLAVPKANRPRAASMSRQPGECKKISDLPPAHFVQFLLQGNWSAGYRPEDIPTFRDGTKRFWPDRVFVRIEPEHVNTLSPEEQRKGAQLGWDMRHDPTEKKFEIDGLRCSVPKWMTSGAYFCRAPGAAADPDADPEVLTLKYFPNSAAPFILIQANYRSPRYGKTHLYWQVWTSNISHALEIDGAIWKTLSEWNLLPTPEAQNGPRS